MSSKLFEAPPILPPFGPDKKFVGGHGNVFVFGSNLEGLHGGGAAAFAVKNCGAIMGEAFGLQPGIGSDGSESYALPTLDVDWVETRDKKTSKLITLPRFRTLTITELAYWVGEFYEWTEANTILNTFVTKIGCGIAGFTEKQVAPLFQRFMFNDSVTLPTGWD